MGACTSARVRRSGGCGIAIRMVSASANRLTEDWDEAQKRLRERLQARDHNTLPALRRGQDLTFGEWADFLSGEFLQASIPGAEDARSESARAEAPEESVREHQPR